MKQEKSNSSPISADQWVAYERFVQAHKRKFRIISAATKGECSAHDVESEAIIVAISLHKRYGLVIDFENPSFRDVLFQHLYQHLVRYTEKTVRFAMQIDHGVGPDADTPHPALSELNAKVGGKDPLELLMEKENALGADASAVGHPSLAAAYLRLLEHCNHQMTSVASHLLLSISYTYQRFAHARVLAVNQRPMPLPLPGPDFVPGPWRRFKLARQQIQLAFDFDEQPAIVLP